MTKLLVLGASEFQIPLLKQARKMGINTCVLDYNENAPGIKYADEYRQCSLKDIPTAVKIAYEYKPNGVTAGMVDVAVCTCARICKELGLPGLSVAVAERSTDKFKMIEAFKANNVPHPQYIYFSKNTFSKEKINLKYPLIVKPIDMAGSRGIELVNSEDELATAVNKSIMASDKGEIIIEEYMVGPEVSVELFVEGYKPYVLQITDKLTSGAPHFMEIGHSQPSSLSNQIKDSIARVACSAVEALGLNNCVAHAEIIITEEGPKMVEIGARMGGDGIQQQLIELSTGINLQEIVIKLAMGEQVSCPHSTIKQASAIRFIPSREGTVVDVEAPEILDKCIKMVNLLCNPGERVSNAKDNSGRLGYVIAQADSASEAIMACEDTIKKVKIVLE